MPNIISKAREKVLKRRKEEIGGSNLSESRKNMEIQRTEELLSRSGRITEKLEEGDLLDSRAVNQTSEHLRLDLMTAFTATDMVSDMLHGVSGNQRSFVRNLSTETGTLADRLTSIEESIKARLNPYHYIEAFRSGTSFEKDPLYYTDRYGEAVGDTMRIKYNRQEQNISLPETVSIDALTGNDVLNAEVFVEKQTGGSFMKIRNTESRVSNVLDGSEDTFWNETILSDQRIRQVSLSDGYETFDGAMCELKIRLESVRRINHISLSPYGEYPISLVSILYTETDNPNEEKKEFVAGHPIPKYSNEETEEDYPLFLDGKRSFRFKDTVVKNIHILFVQTHYTRESLLLNRDSILKTEIWNRAHSTNEKRVYDKQLLFMPLLQEEDPLLPKSVTEKISSISLKNKGDIYTQDLFDDNRNVTVEKYAYSYGFYELSAEYKDYSGTGIYVSSPITSGGTIREMRIEADEYHPVSEDAERPVRTDVEYYVSHSETPGYEDWLPILPINRNVVDCELLQIRNDGCPLRFPAKEILGIYLHSRKLEEGVDYTLRMNGELTTEILIPNYNFNGIYTAKYIPSEESKRIVYGENRSAEQSRFRASGDGSGTYLLPHYADTMYATELNVTDMNTGVQIREDRKELYCVTDPNNPSESYRNFTKNASVLQYYVSGNMLYFNKSVGPEMTIDLDYRHRVSSVRLKTIIRRNSYERWSTPVVSRIRYNFVTE